MQALEIEELSSEKFEKMKKTTICHCRTSVITNELKFEWTLKNFSIPSKSDTTFKATGITHCYQAFTLNVSFNMAKNMIYFHTWFMAEKKNIKANYYIYIDVKGKILYPREVNGIYLTQNMIVYKISLNKIQEYLTCDGLTVYFRFDIIESVSNHFFQTIIDESEESAIDKFALDKRSGLKVHFLLGEKSLSVDKGLLYSKSDNFKDIFEDVQEMFGKTINQNQLTINIAPYDVFKHLVFYLETGSLDKLIVSKDGNIHGVECRMNIRSFCPTQYDKVHETLYELFNLANSYNVKDLALLCETLLIKTMHRLGTEKDMVLAHSCKARTVEKYVRQFLKLYCHNLNYFVRYQNIYTNLVKENLNCHKMSFITEEYDSDTFNA